MNFLNDGRLNEMLEKNDLYLDLKLHPIISGAQNIFSVTSDRIKTVSEVNPENYKIFITDFSSYVFDFVYLKRAILYFVPDILEFRSGIMPYRELDLPFDKAFGELVTDSDSAVKELQKIIANNSQPDKKFSDRMEGFFLDGDNHAERLYEYLIKNEEV